MILRTAALASLLILAACQTRRGDAVTYPTVFLRTPVSCVPADLGKKPQGLETRESLAAIPEGPQRYVRLSADWLARVARMEQTEPVIDGCQKVGPAP